MAGNMKLLLGAGCCGAAGLLWCLGARSPLPCIALILLLAVTLVAAHVDASGTRDWHLFYFLSAMLTSCLLSPHDLGKYPLGDSPLQSRQQHASVPKLLRSWPSDAAVYTDSSLLVLTTICIGSWAICILLVGLGKVHRSSSLCAHPPAVRAAFAVLGFSFFALHGASCGVIGVSHRFYLPMYGVLAVGLEAVFGLPASETVAVSASHVFFSAGLGKLTAGGLDWLNGAKLAHHVTGSAQRLAWQLCGGSSCGLTPRYVRDACRVAAPGAVLFELGAPAVLLTGGRWRRHAFLVCAVGFHLGIAVLMFPRYFPQCVVYALLFRRSGGGGGARGRRGGQQVPCAKMQGEGNSDGGNTAGDEYVPLHRQAHRLPFLSGAAVLACVAALRLECWPVTCVPMYSTAFVNPDHGFGRTKAEAVRRAKIMTDSSCYSDTGMRDYGVRVHPPACSVRVALAAGPRSSPRPAGLFAAPPCRGASRRPRGHRSSCRARGSSRPGQPSGGWCCGTRQP